MRRPWRTCISCQRHAKACKLERSTHPFIIAHQLPPSNTSTRSTIDAIDTNIIALLQQQQHLMNSCATISQIDDKINSLSRTPRIQVSPLVHHRGQACPAPSRLVAWYDGQHLKIKYSNQPGKKRYTINFRLRLWSRLIAGRLTGNLYSLVTVPRLSWRNLVPEDASIFRACITNDGLEVRRLLTNGRASLRDVSPNNFTPLTVSPIDLVRQSSNSGKVAIKHGATEVVQLLLNEGADVNATCGIYET